MRAYTIKGTHILRCGALFIYVAFILLIFIHVGQVNPWGVSRSISMVNMDVSGLGRALENSTAHTWPGIYNSDNHSIGLNEGLQTTYSWGLYSVCGYVHNATWDGGGCSQRSFAHSFAPFEVIQDDTPTKYHALIEFFISDAASQYFTDAEWFTTPTHVACYLTTTGTVSTAMALYIGVWTGTINFILTLALLALSIILLFISSIIWSTLINQAKSINSALSIEEIPVGITIQQGNAYYMLWAAFTLLSVSIIPYYFSLRTFRRFY